MSHLYDHTKFLDRTPPARSPMDCSDISTSETVQVNADCSSATADFPYPSAYDACYTGPYNAHPIISLELPAGFVQKYQVVAGSMITKTSLDSYGESFKSVLFDPLEQFATGFPFSAATTDYIDSELICTSPYSLHSDGPQPRSSSSPELSPSSFNDESPAEADEESTSKTRPRKRGRPRLDRASPHSQSTSSGSSQCQRTSRVPHNQVERKYRQGLNTELERLRRTVPTLPQCSGGRAVGQPQLSKAMVLVGAIEHIKTVERERDALIVENDRLRGMMVV